MLVQAPPKEVISGIYSGDQSIAAGQFVDINIPIHKNVLICNTMGSYRPSQLDCNIKSKGTTNYVVRVENNYSDAIPAAGWSVYWMQTD